MGTNRVEIWIKSVRFASFYVSARLFSITHYQLADQLATLLVLRYAASDLSLF
jgi:hypothetical protein